MQDKVNESNTQLGKTKCAACSWMQRKFGKLRWTEQSKKWYKGAT